MVGVISRGRQQARYLAESLLDRLVASDPGMVRLFFALRVVISVLATVAILLFAVGIPVTIVIVGALLSLNVSTSLNDPDPKRLLLPAAAVLVLAAAALSVAASLAEYRLLADAVFLAVIFFGVYLRKYPSWGTTAGFGGFMSFFVAQFTRLSPAGLPLAVLSAAVGIGCAVVVVTVTAVSVRRHAVDRMLSALRVRVARLLDQVDAVLDSGGAGGRRGHRLDRASEQLHAAALMIEAELEQSADLAVDERVRRTVVTAELAGERLVVAVRWAMSEGLSAAGRERVSAELDQLHRYLRRDPRAALNADQKRLLSSIRAMRPDPAASAVERADSRLRQAVRELVLAVVMVRRDLGPREWPKAESQATAEPEGRDEDAVEAPERPRKFVDRLELTTRQAVQAVIAGAIAITAGELLSSQRWYWAVITAFVVFVGTTSRGDLLVKGFRRAMGTVAGVVIGIVVATPVYGHLGLAAVLIVISVFLAFYFLRVSYALMSFFITVMLSLLYDLLGTFQSGILLLRVEETAIGVAAGALAAVFVLPTRTGEVVGDDLVAFLGGLRSFLSRAQELLVEGESVSLIEESRGVDRTLERLSKTMTPLLHRISPFRGRRNALSYLMTVLDLCAFRARTLAGAAETAALTGCDGFVDNLRRLQINLDRLIATVDRQGKPRKRLAVGSGMSDDTGITVGNAAGRRLLVYFDRLDEAVTALARPIDRVWGEALRARAGESDGDAGRTADPPTVPLDLSAVRE
ncbi:MAG: FUSC family protein [Sciscionella sp.]